MDLFRGFIMNLLLVVFVFSQGAWPCSFAQLGSQLDKASAQNFDFFPHSYNAVVVNKRNMEKSAGFFSGMPANAAPVKWISKYGSITFGYGLENPVSGVNEAGLRVHRFLFDDAKYPAPNGLPAVKESQYVQYILDTAKNIAEVIAQTRAVQIYAENAATHFAFCDEAAECAVIEAENGNINIYSGSSLQVAALTNEAYPVSLNLWAKCPAGDCKELTNSQWRFITVANQVKQFTGADIKQGVFDILHSVNQVIGVETVWTILTHANSSENKFYLKNVKSSNTVLNLDFKNLDYSCKTPVKVALLYSDDMSSSIQLTDYTKQFQTTITGALAKLGVSASEMQKLIDYPEKYTRCLN